MSDRLRCIAEVLKRDTYRVSRRGSKSGFAMHYTRNQCSRMAIPGTEFCRQHTGVEKNRVILVCEWAERLPVTPAPVSSPRT